MENAMKKNRVWAVSKVIINVIFYIFIILLVLFAISNLKVKKQGDIPNLFGKGYVTVNTSSMDGDEKDSFSKNDLVIVDVVNNKNRSKVVSKLEIGDIITFKAMVDGKQDRNTHRIVNIIDNGDNKAFITQGDNVAGDKYVIGESVDVPSNCEMVSSNDILGVFSKKISNVGKTVKFIQSERGFLLCIVFPTVLFFIFEAFVLTINIMKMKQSKKEALKKVEEEKAQEEARIELEKERERMKEELRKEIEAEKERERMKEELTKEIEPEKDTKKKKKK